MTVICRIDPLDSIDKVFTKVREVIFHDSLEQDTQLIFEDDDQIEVYKIIKVINQ